MGQLNIEGMTADFKRHLLSSIELNSRYAYVTQLDKRSDTTQIINRFVNQMANNRGKTPRSFISENAGEYTPNVMTTLIGNMDTEHVPKISHNQEYNGVSKRFSGTIINATRASLTTDGMIWSYWM